MKQKFIAFGIVGLAFVLTIGLIKSGKKSSKQRPPQKPPVVRTVEVTPGVQQAQIFATAVVEANQRLNLSPEIPGRVVWVSPKLEAGGVVKKGEVLLRLDSRDHKLKVKQTQVNVENAQLALEQEQARAEVAREEWEALGESETASDLVLRVRQQEVARLNKISAESSLEQAKLNLARTEIRAPFNATVVRKNAAVGQVVMTQSVLAELVERGDLLAEVSLPVSDLSWIEIPGVQGATKGSTVSVRQELGGGAFVERTGHVENLVGSIDQQTRRAVVLVRIPTAKEEGLPLLPGAFVQVEISGVSVENALRIPRALISKGTKIWEVRDDATLASHDIDRLWGDDNFVVASSFGTESIRLAVSLPEAPVTGMKITPMEGGNE